MNELEFHPIANIFPMMEGDALNGLIEDIKNNGLLEAIWLYEDKILDGRNRYVACIDAKVKPRFRDYKGDNPLGFVLSLNLQRRHLDASQRACLAQEILPYFEEQAKERQIQTQFGGGGKNSTTEDGKARDFVAYEFNVNSHYIQDAKLVKAESPTLFEEVKAGLIHLKEAVNTIKKDKREADRAKLAEDGAKVPSSDRWHVYHGDIATWIAPRQYDFIITDPPYPKEYLPLYETLAKRAVEWLKPGGLLVAMSAHFYMNEIYKTLDEHLHYFWTSAYLVPGQTAGVYQKHVNTQWKPLIMYEKNGAPFKGRSFADVFKSDANDKDFHKWGQSVSGMYDIISKIATPGQYILDPFCGAGTTGVASVRYGCLFDGLDLSTDNVNVSKSRINKENL